MRMQNEQKAAAAAPWLPAGFCNIVVGRNSDFFEEELDDEELEMLGCLEYRCTRLLTILLIIVSGYSSSSVSRCES